MMSAFSTYFKQFFQQLFKGIWILGKLFLKYEGGVKLNPSHKEKLPPKSPALLLLKWFESYFKNKKQCIQIDRKTKKSLQYVKCRVPQGSILDPIIFLIYVNDFLYTSHLSQPIKFADDTDSFYAENDIKRNSKQ